MKSDTEKTAGNKTGAPLVIGMGGASGGIIGIPLTDLFELQAMTLATAGDDNHPHSAPLWYVVVYDSDSDMDLITSMRSIKIYFTSLTNTKHVHDLTKNSKASVSIYYQDKDWDEIRGIQMRGVASQVDTTGEMALASTAFMEKYPFMKKVSTIKSVLEAIKLSRWYCFRPEWIRLVDNKEGFGHNQEWALN